MDILGIKITPKENIVIRFSPANAKLKNLYNVKALRRFLKGNRKVYSFDIASGHSCPYAKDCLSKAVEQSDGKFKIVDGKNTEFRCFSASQEVVFPSARKMRFANFESLKGLTKDQMAIAIHENLPANVGIVRIHVAGDFFNQSYFDAWMAVAITNPKILFYAYTKSLPYWVNRIGMIPENFVLTASIGGRKDEMIETYNLRSVKVILHPSESAGLEIDHTDEHAAIPEKRNQDFTLLIHGIQRTNTAASAAISRLKKEKIQFAYS